MERFENGFEGRGSLFVFYGGVGVVAIMEKELVGVFVEVDKPINGFAEMVIGGWTKGNGFADDAHGLEVVYEGNEVAITRDKYNDINARRNGHGINGHANVPISFFLAAGKFLHVFDFEFDAVRGQGFKKSRFFAGFGFSNVGNGTYEFASADSGLDECGEVHARAIEMLPGVVHVLCVDKNGDTL